MDCFEKRGNRGYLFVIGDEVPYPKIKRKEVERVIGDKLQEDLPTEKLVLELERTFDVYYILPRMTHHWENREVQRRWVELLGQNVLRLEEPSGICEMIAGTIGLAEGVINPGRVETDLVEAGSQTEIARAVGHALAPWAKSREKSIWSGWF
jgi:hypothetical protein